jgi:hypothetical protein
MHGSTEQLLKAVDEQKAKLRRLSHQFDADEFKVVMERSLALAVILQKLIAEQTNEQEELAQEPCGLADLTEAEHQEFLI